ncbi:hypothetical protein KR009_010922 [Drosophila setifemur]|nr:hypothetical protein KR009_010922 [Drosophila setifemur]
MSDRYPSGFYDQQHYPPSPHQHPHHPLHPTPNMSHYPPQPYRSGYTGYHPYSGYGYGSGSASYMPNYYRYAPYASPHYSQPHSHAQGMFTPAGQQLIPSSVLHYPPRSHPYQPQPQPQPQPPQSPHPGYEQPAPSPYSSSASYQNRGFGGYSGYVPPGRSSTPAPNRTVLPPNYLEPLRNYTEQHQHLSQQQQQHLNQQQQQQQQHLPLPATPKLEESEIEVEAGAGSPSHRLTTSPPMISATGTDSGISNCSTRARSDSSQSTPVYSGEYPVNMSVESASCVPYHCPADGRDFEEEELPLEERRERGAARRTDTPLDIAAQSALASASASTSPVGSDKVKQHPPPTPPEVERCAEINLPKETPTDATATTMTPQDAAPPDPISDAAFAEEEPGHAVSQQHPVAALTSSNHWSPSPRCPRTPPAPQNSPVGFGQTDSIPPALAPLLQQQQQQQQQLHQQQQQHQHQAGGNQKRSAASGRNRSSNSLSNSLSNSHTSSNNRIIECDLIPSKKSKRKAKKESGDSENMEAVEPTIREQIRDIKPLPGFLQAFGSTEIGRFSERFLQTSESLVERLAEEYAVSAPINFPSPHPSAGYIDSPATPPMSNHYYPYEEQNHGSYPRNRMRHGYGYEMPDYMAYERYAAYGAGRPRARYGEIRCNGY